MARRRRTKVSKVEKEILKLLKAKGYNVIAQFKIDGLPFIFDFYFPESKLFLEFQGIYWHASPKKYKAGSMINIAGLGQVYVDYIWDRDAFKRKSAEKLGFTVKELWEDDYKENGWEAIEKLLV